MSATATKTERKMHVGRRIRRQEDPRLLTGAARYVDDIQKPGMLFAAILRSPHAAARITGVATERAAALPGVRLVLTGQDVARIGPVPCGVSLPGLRVPVHTVLATGRVYYAGHPIAVVVASDRYVAQDAIERIDADFEPLEAVTGVEKALEAGAPAVHPEWPDNVAFTYHQEGGDVEKAFAEADLVVKQRIVSPRLAPAAMETRGVLADYDEGTRELTIYCSTQTPHLLRTELALQLNLPEHRLRVIAPEVGGGFGSKIDVYAEDALVGYLAIRLKQPVKWVESRRENLLATIHGRGHVDYAELAAKRDGTLTGMKLKLLQDIGSFQSLLTPLMPTLSVLMMPGIYKIQSIKADIVGVFTNCMATDAYRGAGRPEATYVIERMVDIMADELGIDAAEIRRKNFPSPRAFPFTTATGAVYDSGNYSRCLDRLLEVAGYDGLLEEQGQARQAGRLMGVGISTYGELSGAGPSPALPAGGWESAAVRVEPTGKVTVLTGISPHGQGQETTFSQMAADALGVPMDDVTVVHGDTARVQYGIGTFGSRGAAIGGTAVHLALEDIRNKAIKYAAHLLGSRPENVTFESGVFSAPDSDASLTFQEVAREAHLCKNLPPATEPGLSVMRSFEPPNFTYPFGAHLAVVEIDRDTGEVEIQRYVGVDDCGKIINPLLVDGQIHGGVAQGLGQALLEEVVYDDGGQLLTGTLADYALPKASHMPWVESHRTETPSTSNPLGVKGVGESGTIGSVPALVNAVVDALSPLGVKHLDMPLTPQKIWREVGKGSSS